MNFFPIYKRAFFDLFSREVFFAFFTPFMLIIAIFAGEAFLYTNYVLPFLQSLITFTENEIVLAILNVVITIFVMSILIIVNIFIGINMIGLFFMEKIVQKINERYYNKELNSEVSIQELFKITTANFFKYFKILLITLPFTFIPVVGAFIPLIPAFLFFHKTMLIDTGSNITEVKNLDLKDKMFGVLIFPVFLMTLVPIIGSFGYVLGFILSTHYLLDDNMRKELK